MALTQVNSGGIKDDSIVNADIKSDAAIALSKLASTPAVLTGSADNTITTVTGANAIQGEANFTYNGTNLQVKQTGDTGQEFIFDSNRSAANNTLGGLAGYWDTDRVADINFQSGADTTNKDDGYITFRTSPSQGSIAERMRIDSSGNVGIGITPTARLHVNGLSTADIITARAADSNGNSIINILSEGTTGSSRINFSDTAGIDGQISYSHNSRALTFTAGGTSEKLRLNNNGDLLLGTSSVPTSYIGAHTLAVIDDSDVNAAVIEVGGSNNGNNYNAGSIQFINNANSNSTTAWDAGSKIVHIIRAQIATSDNNAGDDSGADLVFYRKPEAGAGTEGFRIKSTGDVSLANGNLVVASGHGIDFSATSDASGATSELLDDYEEGTWTPAGTNLPTPSVSYGKYMKIGRTVHAWWQMEFGSDGGNAIGYINNLPFTSEDASPYNGGTAWDYRTSPDVNVHISSNSNRLYWYTDVGNNCNGDDARIEGEQFRACTTYRAAS